MSFDPQYLSTLVASLDRSGANQQRISNQISSGVRVASLGDDPSAATQNVLLSSQIAADSTFTQTAATTTGVLQVTDSTLGAVIDQINRALSVSIAGNNGTNTQSDRASVAAELSGIRDEIVGLANTSYSGRYLFSGTVGGTPPFRIDTTTSPVTTIYQGDTRVNVIRMPFGQSIATNLPGSQVFTAAGGDLLGTLNALIDGFSTGSNAATTALTPQLTAALSQVSTQRTALDSSINRLQSASSYATQERTQLLADQSNLLQTDFATAATALSASETQQSAIESVIVSLEKQGSLFDRL